MEVHAAKVDQGARTQLSVSPTVPFIHSYSAPTTNPHPLRPTPLPPVPLGEATLERYRPRAYSERVGGRSMAAAGCEPILHMRHFQQHKALSQQLVDDITTRCGR